MTRKWLALALIAAAQVGAMSTWFSAGAVAPSLAAEWGLAPGQIALLTVAVQIGFVVGALTSAISGVADVLSPRLVFVASAIVAMLANLLLIVADGSLGIAIALRGSLGFFLAGVYPVGMKLMTEWFRAERGLAIGTLVGALTLGAALPHLISGADLGGAFRWQNVIVATSLACLLSAVLMATLGRRGPFEAPSARLDLRWAIRSLGDPALRLANFGYFGHMWELYAMWTWVPAFLLASLSLSWGSADLATVRQEASLASALVIGAGAIGCVGAGLLADRVGRTTVTSVAMVTSGSSAILAGLLFGQAPVLVIAVALVWGISVIADSAQFSAAVSELAEPRRVGSALAMQTSAGFLLTAVSIQLLPLVQSWLGWSLAFMMLAVGPALGTVAMLRLRVRPESLRLAGGKR